MAKLNWDRANREKKMMESGTVQGNDELPFTSSEAASKRRQKSKNPKAQQLADKLKSLINKLLTKKWSHTEPEDKLKMFNDIKSCIKSLERLNNPRYLNLRLWSENIVREKEAEAKSLHSQWLFYKPLLVPIVSEVEKPEKKVKKPIVKATKHHKEVDQVELIAQEILKFCKDIYSIDFYRKVARTINPNRIFRTIDKARTAQDQQETKKSIAENFNSLIKQYAKEKGIDLE